MRLSPIFVLSLLVLHPFFVVAQDHEHAAPYAGMESRDIKALSPEETAALLAGEGMGFALVAELNGYPGPKHVLELADALELTPDQRTRTERVMAEMLAEARRLGQALVEGERGLDAALAGGALTMAALAGAVRDLGALRGELRGVHLRAHLDMAGILTEHQTQTYRQLRGYGVEHGGAGVEGPFTGEVKPVLYVADVGARAPFYRDVLGFELLNYAPGADGTPYYAEMSAGGLRFGLHEPMNDRQREWVGHQRLYFRVRDVAAHRAAVEANGVRPAKLIETAWMDMFIVRDPDGHEIVFAETDPARHTVDPW